MSRRRSEPGLLETALKADWRFSAVLSGSALVLAFVVLPIVARDNFYLRAVTPASRGLGLVFAGVFALIALVKFVARRNPVAPTRVTTPRQAWSPTSRVDPSHRAAAAAADAAIERRSERPLEPRTAKPSAWSIELLRSLDWKRFEEVVAAYFREKSFRCETIAFGPDGGIDARLYFGADSKAVGIVQCKAWGDRVGVAPVRELLGVMTHEKVSRGYFAATGDFTSEAVAFAKSNPILLISGNDFLTAIERMDPTARARLLAISTEGDFTTPTCASCGAKLHRKTFRGGGTAWVCRNYPRCRTRIWTKAA